MNEAVNIKSNLNELSKALTLYKRASGKVMEEVLEKKGKDLGYALRREFLALMPVKGSISESRIEALKGGEGVRVRPSVMQEVMEKYHAQISVSSGAMMLRRGSGKHAATQMSAVDSNTGRRLNLQALAVRRELALRESGRGFMGQSAAFGATQTALSRYGPSLAVARLDKSGGGLRFMITWGGLSSLSDAAVAAIGRSRGQAAVANAIAYVTSDIMEYVDRKMKVNAEGLR